MNKMKCLHCAHELQGRVDQKFCNPYCKSAYHYKMNKLKPSSTYVTIDMALKNNRKILKKYNTTGQSQIKKEKLLEQGFNFKYTTHTWTAKNGNTYHFCYEFGYRDLLDGKYMLIVWQDYMY